MTNELSRYDRGTGLGLFRRLVAGATRVLGRFKPAGGVDAATRAVTGALPRIDETLRRIFDVAPDVIGARRLSDGRFRYFNAEFTKVHGWTREEALSMTFEELDLWNDPAQREEFFREFEANGVVRNFEADFRVRRRTAVEPMLVSAVRVDLNNEPHLVSVLRDISDLRRAERRIAESEARLRTFFEACPDLVAVIRLSDDVCVYVNPEFSRVTGYSSEYLLGRTASELGMWVDVESQRRFNAALVEHGSVRNFEQDVRMRDGRIETHLISAVLVEIVGESHMLAIGREVTTIKKTEADLTAARERLSVQLDEMERNQRTLRNEIIEREGAQSRLRQSETKLRKVFDTSLDAISIRRLDDGRYLDVNPAFLSLTGYTYDEVVGYSVDELRIRVGDAPTHFENSMNALGFVHNRERWLRRKDGTIIPIMVSAVAIDIDGVPAAVIVTRDITEAKRAADKLRESEDRLRRIFDANLDAISVRRLSDNVYREVNSKFLKLTGYSRDEVIGHSREELRLLEDESRATLDEIFQRQGELNNSEGVLRRKDGTLIPVIGSAVPFDLEGEKCALCIIRDITQSKAAERELSLAHEAALAASRAKSEFLSSMSHEIRTPMHVILGMAEVLSETQLDPKQHLYLQTMRANGDALLLLINQILDLSRIESGRLALERTDFDLIELIEGAIVSFAPRVREKGLTISRRIASGVPRYWIGDPLRIRQILINLIDNAIKFTEKGGIAVSVNHEESVSNSADDSSRILVRFSVSDTGIGIEPGSLESIFSSFTQADASISRRYGGTGLGLAIVKRLVELHEGTIEVRSEPGRGSTFTFSIPLQNVESTSSIQVEDSAAPDVTRNELTAIGPARKILLVEDSSDNRMLIRNYLRLSDYLIDEAIDGNSAIGKFMSDRYDVVLMDIQMPDVDGYAAVRAMREWEERSNHPHTPIIALSTSVLDEAACRGIKAGFDAHLSQPVHKSTLITEIERAIEAANQRLITTNGIEFVMRNSLRHERIEPK
jgi:PAS domain S-box-containing protein